MVVVVEATEFPATRNKKSGVRIDKMEIETSWGRGDLVCSGEVSWGWRGKVEWNNLWRRRGS